MANKIVELKKDIAELQALENTAARQKVKDIIAIEIRKLTSELIKLEDNQRELETPSNSKSIPAPRNRYEVNLTNYAWDQSDKFVKFYVTLKNVHQIPAENLKCLFASKSLELSISNLDNKDYSLKIKHLLHTINPEQSSWKVKTDMVIISAAKTESTSWSHVTEFEKKVADNKVPKMNENADSTDGLMNMMKNIYEQGDDEMKRTIAKAWTESRNKGLQL